MVSAQQALRLGVAYKLIARSRGLDATARMRASQQELLQPNVDVVVLAAMASSSAKGERRHITRALGKWRGSTVAGYLRDGDDQTLRHNFRCSSRARFDHLVSLFKGGKLDRVQDQAAPRSSCLPNSRPPGWLKACAARDTPDVRDVSSQHTLRYRFRINVLEYIMLILLDALIVHFPSQNSICVQRTQENACGRKRTHVVLSEPEPFSVCCITPWRLTNHGGLTGV